MDTVCPGITSDMCVVCCAPHMDDMDAFPRTLQLTRFSVLKKYGQCGVIKIVWTWRVCSICSELLA